MSDAQFLKRPEDFKGEFFPDFVRAVVTQAKELGKRVGVSVGLIPKESRKPSQKDEDMFGSDVDNVVSKWKMLEWSIAPVQSNEDAVVLSASNKRLEPKEVAKLYWGDDALDTAMAVQKGKKPKPRPKVYIFIPQAAPVRPKRKPVDYGKLIASAARREVARQTGKLYLTR